MMSNESAKAVSSTRASCCKGTVVDVVEPLPGRHLRGVAAHCPSPFEVGLVHDGQSAVEPFQGEGDRVEGRERGLYGALGHERSR